MSSRGKLFILSAPGGTGKTTLVQMLTKELPHVHQSISCTTRPKRNGEVDGVDYHFISRDAFEEKRSKGDFLEWAELFGNLYGTSKASLEKTLQKGHHLFLVIDTQGAAQVKEKMAVITIFVSPPSMEELKKRLLARQADSPEKIAKRLERAKEEIEAAKSYDYHIINDDLETAYQALRSIVLAEEKQAMKFSAYLTAEPISKRAENLFELINRMIRMAKIEIARGAGEESLNVAYEIIKAVSEGKDRLEWMDRRVIEREFEAKEELIVAP